MGDDLKKYLEWRFRMSNHHKYHNLCHQWLSKITAEQLAYFEKEMVKMIDCGKYNLWTTYRLKEVDFLQKIVKRLGIILYFQSFLVSSQYKKKDYYDNYL